VSCFEAMAMQSVMEFVAYGWMDEWMNEWIWCGWIFNFVSLHFDSLIMQECLLSSLFCDLPREP
jgi:hypothetical protein